MSDDDTQRHDESLYDPTHHGPLYLGTRTVRYWLIDPAARSFSESKIERWHLDTLPALLGLPEQRLMPVPMERDESRTVMALHDLWVQQSPAPDAKPFWYQADRHKPATRYQGMAFIVARSRDKRRMASQRISRDLMGHLFHWAEPTPEPESLALKRLLKPALDAISESADHMDKVREAAGGELPGLLSLRSDARQMIGVINVLAKHLARSRSVNTDEVAVITFLEMTHERLTEEGYLDIDNESPQLAEQLDRHGL